MVGIRDRTSLPNYPSCESSCFANNPSRCRNSYYCRLHSRSTLPTRGPLRRCTTGGRNSARRYHPTDAPQRAIVNIFQNIGGNEVHIVRPILPFALASRSINKFVEWQWAHFAQPYLSAPPQAIYEYAIRQICAGDQISRKFELCYEPCHRRSTESERLRVTGRGFGFRIAAGDGIRWPVFCITKG